MLPADGMGEEQSIGIDFERILGFSELPGSHISGNSC